MAVKFALAKRLSSAGMAVVIKETVYQTAPFLAIVDDAFEAEIVGICLV